jgi:hypothetical protein
MRQVLTPRANSSPRIVALLPQRGDLDNTDKPVRILALFQIASSLKLFSVAFAHFFENSQKSSWGMNVIPLPFSDDIRQLQLPKPIKPRLDLVASAKSNQMLLPLFASKIVVTCIACQML